MTEPEPTPAPPPRRPLRKRLVHALRRAHLYFGLFLVPWAVLYGVTGFLFNHPTAFADAPTCTFGPKELAGTPMADPPAPADVARAVLAHLPPAAGRYELVEPEKARYTREFAFAVAKTDGGDVGLLFDVTSPAGTVRASPPAPAPVAPTLTLGPKATTTRTGERFVIPDALDARVRASVPTVLERTGFATGAVAVTSTPDLVFRAADGSAVYAFTYNAHAGTVSAAPVGPEAAPEGLSARRFLTRLHLASGYPHGRGAKWFWAVLVDAMAFVMVFWAGSGLLMWWQVKAARGWGLVVLLASAVAATALGFGMHAVLSPR
jgi:hypothetical protein